jgi:hypothetical protein
LIGGIVISIRAGIVYIESVRNGNSISVGIIGVAPRNVVMMTVVVMGRREPVPA